MTTVAKVALVTGATDGIGRATALRLARYGFALHVLGRDAARGERVLADLNHIAPGRPHALYLVDMSDLDAVEQFLRQYTDGNDTLDLLVLNANAWVRDISVAPAEVDVVFALRLLAKCTGLIEPEESGRRIVRHVLETRAEDVGGKYYALEKEKRLPAKLTGSRDAFDRLAAYSERVTGVALGELKVL